MSRRLRVVLMVAGGAVAAAVLALVVALYLLLRPERFTAMLQAQAEAIGLELHLAQPASPTLFPRPALDLRGITLNARHSTYPILLAARGRLALPWRTLLGGATAISQLEIEAPRVDLDALQAWVDALPPRAPGHAMRIPRIDAGVSIRRGSIVRGNQLLLDDVTLDAGSLRPGQAFPITLSAQTADGAPLALRVSATPGGASDGMRFDDISLHLTRASSLVVALAGSLEWHDAAGFRAKLAGKIDYADGGEYDVALEATPAAGDEPPRARLQLDGPGSHADVRLSPRALAGWWSGVTRDEDPLLHLPPGDASVELGKIEVAGVRIRGLSIQAGADVPGAASTAAPAQAAPAKPATKQAGAGKKP